MKNLTLADEDWQTETVLSKRLRQILWYLLLSIILGWHFCRCQGRPHGMPLLLHSLGKVMPTAKPFLSNVHTNVYSHWLSKLINWRADGKCLPGTFCLNGVTPASVTDTCQPQKSEAKDHSRLCGDLDLGGKGPQPSVWGPGPWRWLFQCSLAMGPIVWPFPASSLVFGSVVHIEIFLYMLLGKGSSFILLFVWIASCPSLCG